MTEPSDRARVARAGWVSSPIRLGVALAVGLVVGVLAAVLGTPKNAPLVGWDAAALVFVAWVWITVIAPMSASDTASHATRQDPGKATSDVVVIAAAVASLAGVAVVIAQATGAKGAEQDLLAGFGVVSVALSWGVVHTLFALRYAELYYTGTEGGIDFNQHTPPRYLDFAYVALTLGMTFQVSDTDLQDSRIRATALRQALLSFLFVSVILATTINLVAGLGSGGG